MNVASLELCKELYELSGWETKKDDTNLYHIQQEGEHSVSPVVFDNCCWREYEGNEIVCPAYDLGYLLRKLPMLIPAVPDDGDPYLFQMTEGAKSGTWQIDYRDVDDGQFTAAVADTPEDAACALLIKLIEEKVIEV